MSHAIRDFFLSLGRILAVVSIAAAGCASALAADIWPAHPITMICPFSAGTTSDIVARIIAQGLSRELGVPVIVEDRVGASGNIGMSLVAKAAPDGYTLGMGTISTHAINQALFAKMPYEVDDFVPLGIIGITPNLLVVPASSSIMTVGDLVAAAKANPGKLTFASSGNGTTGG